MLNNQINILVILLLVISVSVNCQSDYEKSKLTEVWEPVPQIVSALDYYTPPSDAIILLGEGGLSEWEHEDGSSPKWKFDNGVMTVKDSSGLIRTKRKFGDCQLHIEWRTPLYAKGMKTKDDDKIFYLSDNNFVVGEGQGRGNSGVFLQERYEVQILDSYNNMTYSNGQAGSVYKQHIPLVNASKEPGKWQTYDIFFTAPKFEETGELKTPGYVTVLHNGVLIQNHVEIKGPVKWIGEPEYEKHSEKESLMLQDHGNPVSFRNIWIREL